MRKQQAKTVNQQVTLEWLNPVPKSLRTATGRISKNSALTLIARFEKDGFQLASSDQVRLAIEQKVPGFDKLHEYWINDPVYEIDPERKPLRFFNAETDSPFVIVLDAWFVAHLRLVRIKAK